MTADESSLTYSYYLIGERPIRIGYATPEVPVIAEILNLKTKKFEIDNLYISIIAENLDAIKIGRSQFVEFCLKNGAKAPA